MITLMTFALLVPLIALLYVGLLMYMILKAERGTGRVVEIHEFIKEGAKAFIKRQYMIIFTVIIAIDIVLLVLFGFRLALAYLLGALSSTAAGIIGMYTAVNTNARTVAALSRYGLHKALKIAFRGGSVLGFLVVGLGVLGIAALTLIYSGWFKDMESVAQALRDVIGYSFGASTVALFARVGGGIYTKAADIGADLVGKVEVGIPEDDPRNPGVIADNVGDNVGDCAGMGADLFESYVGSIVSAMVLGLLVTTFREQLVVLPLIVAGIGIVSSLIAAQILELVRGKPSTVLQAVSVTAIALTAIITLVYLAKTLPDMNAVFAYWLSVVLGLVTGAIIGFTSDYFTSKDKPPAQKVARLSQAGPALTILTGLSMGFLSVFIPTVAIGLSGLAAFLMGSSVGGFYGGLYAVALAAVGMLSVTGIIVAADAYGPIVDNAAGISEMAELDPEIRDLADTLDSAGNTMKSISKGYAIGSAALTALALLFAYMAAAGLDPSRILLLDAKIIAGFFIGATLPALFTALVISSVSDAAFVLVEEIRRQFREIKGLLEGKAKPNYARCVDIATKYSLRKLLLPGLLAIISPLVIGFILGPEALAGALIGAIVIGLILGLFQGNVGNTWDNAKKYIELGAFGGKGSEAHKAAVVGDTVGDPLKDAAGPSINILIKLMSVISLVFATLIATHYILRF
ncbi:sodium-translocating pyrophosphatase [Archaeoglobales archaeon]|nr:MAG: sodium-translocating pyrophosphatase [Archaeoglobales archaeon]